MVNKILVVALLLMSIWFGVILHSHRVKPIEELLTPDETKWVLNELIRLNAEPCVLEPTAYGWKCTAAYDKVYKVYPKECGVKEKKI